MSPPVVASSPVAYELQLLPNDFLYTFVAEKSQLMDTVLASHGLQFRPDWVALPLSRWELLEPAWQARYDHIETRGERETYEVDAITQWTADFLALQGHLHFTPEAWRLYRESGYDLRALAAGTVFPSPEVAHAHVQRLTEAMQKLYRQVRQGTPLDLSTFTSVVSTAVEGTPYRNAGLNGPIQTLPPAEIESALNALLTESHAQLGAGVSPITVAAWAHHAITRIRPFADGNARAAFLLTQYILWRGGLPGFYLHPGQRLAYYTALKQADEGSLQDWFNFTLLALQQATLYALSWTPAVIPPYETALQTFNQRFAGWRKSHNRDRSQRIITNRYTVFDYMEEILHHIAKDLEQHLRTDEGQGVRALIAKAYPDSPYYHQFTADIVEYARSHRYFFNRSLARGWFKIKFSLSASKKYQLVLSLHHAGYEDATMVVGAFLHYLEPVKYQQKRLQRRRTRTREKATYLFAPLPFYAPPLAFSVEQDAPALRSLMREYVESLLGQAITRITDEIY